MDIFEGLNPAQTAAVTASPGPTLVLAGPGSGKTRVLTHRIAYLIRELDVAPWRIMAVTFTNKAAREMRERLEKLLDGPPAGILMGTFHATCARILRRETDALVGYQSDFVIFDTDDQKQVVKQALKDLNIDDKRFPPAKMLNGISSAKNELITPDIYASTNYVSEVTRRVYERYQDTLVANNAMDFDDLLLNTVLLFDQSPDVLARYQQKYQDLLVDEFQDTNTAQYALLSRLAAAHRNLFVVGDSDQSIYKWRGADFRNINRFRDAYPDAHVILLEQNYRSTQVILDAAKAVIRRNQDRVDKDLFTMRKGGVPIDIQEAYNESEEAQTIVDQIERRVNKGQNSAGDFAIMYRTNAQSRAIEEAFIRAGMKYRLVGATRFYGRREVKDLIAYLRLIHNAADSVSCNRIVNVPTRGIGAKTQQKLREWGARLGWQPGEALIKLATDPDVQHPFTSRAYSALSNFGNLLSTWRQLAEIASVQELLDLVIEQTGYRQYIDDDTPEGRDRWANVMELQSVAGQDSSVALTDFLETVALVSETDNLADEHNVPTLLTLHAAKGLEFPIVFITGLEEGILPHTRALDDGEELAEERRLFYVGLTRAKNAIYLSHTLRRTMYGSTDLAVPSRFLSDIPAELTTGNSAAARRDASKARASAWTWSREDVGRDAAEGRGQRSRFGQNSTTGRSRPAAEPRWTRGERGPSRSGSRRNAPAPEPAPDPYVRQRPHRTPPPEAAPPAQYTTGQKVRHATFGDGIVIESKSTGADVEVTVAFGSVGIKRLAASFARLESVE